MKNYLLSICYRLGLPPTIWMVHNPIKIYEYLEATRTTGLKTTDIVLDLGCGQGIWTSDLARHCHKAIGVDISQDAIHTAQRYVRNSPLKNRLEFHQGRLEGLEFPSSSLDHIFSFCVLEHIDNLANVLLEAKRLLRPGGHLHVSVDSLATITNPALKEKHQRDHFVIQYFSVDSLQTMLTDAGFVIEGISPILKGDLALSEFQKRILGQSYHYGWFARKNLVKSLREEDDEQQSTDTGIIIVAHATL